VFLSSTCGGADSYGYVSAAQRLRAGDVTQVEPLASLLPFPDGIAAACPLGYVPSGRVANASVPAYPLGLPAVMAAATALFGAGAAFAVAPAMGLVLLAAAYIAARRWFDDPHVALVACALLAAQPLVFTYAIQPMSDVPAAAAVMVALALLTSRDARWHAPAAGMASGLALAIRPALAPAVVAIGLLPLLIRQPRRWRDAFIYTIPIGGAVLLQGWEQHALYGSPFASGYGSIAGLFSTDTAAANVRSYSYWAWWALGPIWIAAAAIGYAAAHRTAVVAVSVVGIGVFATYLFYRPYDHWETLRFLLPALAPITLIAAHGLMVAGRAVAGVHAAAVAALLTAACAP
jgi:hypothetical protein